MAFVVPTAPSIFHITHVSNLASMIGARGLLSDAAMVAQGGPKTMIGMSVIKLRRLNDIAVSCHVGTKVGDYVPFYFCPRSIMLYIISMKNHPELAYKGGQEPIVHLEADMHSVIAWADQQQPPHRWAFSLQNAGSFYASFRCTVPELDQVNWPAVQTNRWADAAVKEGKQAEFLVHTSFPWPFVRRIGVHSMAVYQQVMQALATSAHKPTVEILPGWYY